MIDPMNGIHAQGGGYGPPPGGYGGPPGMPGGGMPGGYGGPPQGMPGGPMAPPGGAPMAPPGGGMGGGPPDLQAHVNKWFNLSILSIFCGCGLLGLINVYMAHQAKQALAAGDVNTAQDKIKLARTLCIVGYVLVALNVVLGIIYGIFMAVAMS